MRPIRAIRNYKAEVPIEIDNPLHADFLGGDTALEDRQAFGFVTDILILDDSFATKVLDGFETSETGSRMSKYKDTIVQRSGVYVVFWEDCGNYYQMRIEDFNSITVDSKDMRNYIANAIRHGV